MTCIVRRRSKRQTVFLLAINHTGWHTSYRRSTFSSRVEIKLFPCNDDGQEPNIRAIFRHISRSLPSFTESHEVESLRIFLLCTPYCPCRSYFFFCTWKRNKLVIRCSAVVVSYPYFLGSLPVLLRGGVRYLADIVGL